MFKTNLWPYLSLYFITLVCDFEDLIVTCNDLLTKWIQPQNLVVTNSPPM